MTTPGVYNSGAEGDTGTSSHAQYDAGLSTVLRYNDLAFATSCRITVSAASSGACCGPTDSQGGFREDLYYRLDIVSLQTAPLADRTEDIEPLSKHFLAKLTIRHGMALKHLSDEALRALHDYSWPGNVRQLENVLERAALYSDGDWILPDALPTLCVPPTSEREVASDGPSSGRWTDVRAPDDAGPAEQESPWITLSELEREHLARTLEETHYNQSEAARLLDIDRNLLRRKIKRHDIDVSKSKRGRPAGRIVMRRRPK